MKFTGKNGQVSRVYQPGYTLDLTGGIPHIRLTTAEDTQYFMRALAGGSKVALATKLQRRADGKLFNTGVDIAEIEEEGTQDVIRGQLLFQQNHQKHVHVPLPPLTPHHPPHEPPDDDDVPPIIVTGPSLNPNDARIQHQHLPGLQKRF